MLVSPLFTFFYLGGCTAVSMTDDLKRLWNKNQVNTTQEKINMKKAKKKAFLQDVIG